MWLSVSLYSTCFMASWPVVEMAPFADFSSASFYIPFFKQSGGFLVPTAEVGTTIITYWWWLILAVMLVVRNRPRWLAIALIPSIYLVIVFGTYVFMTLMNILDL